MGHSDGPSNAVETALALALTEAAKAGRFDVVSQLARQLESLQRAPTGVVDLETEARRRGRR